MRRALRGLLRLLTVVTCAYHALWACAPAATFRPMTLDIGESEVGVGANWTGTTSDAPVARGGSATGLGPNAQLWYDHRFTRRFSFGGTVFGGATSLFGVGGLARFHLVDEARWRVGADVQAGWLWAEVGVPVSYRLVDDLWVYSSPSVGFRQGQSVRVPVGLAWGLTDVVWLQAEAGWGIDLVTQPVDPIDAGRWSGSFAASFRF